MSLVTDREALAAHFGVIVADAALDPARFSATPLECAYGCDTTGRAAQVCCGMVVCAGCFPDLLRQTDLAFRCRCGKDLVPWAADGPFPKAVAAMREAMEFENVADRALCPGCFTRCGCDDLTQPRVACPTCALAFCIFCKRALAADCVANDGGGTTVGCGPSCTILAMTTFELVPFRCADGTTIPNRRMCPNCHCLGAYDNKCKFHVCAQCGLEYCFLCLLSKEECGTSYGDRCVADPAVQKLATLPTAATRGSRPVRVFPARGPPLHHGFGDWEAMEPVVHFFHAPHAPHAPTLGFFDILSGFRFRFQEEARRRDQEFVSRVQAHQREADRLRALNVRHRVGVGGVADFLRHGNANRYPVPGKTRQRQRR